MLGTKTKRNKKQILKKILWKFFFPFISRVMQASVIIKKSERERTEYFQGLGDKHIVFYFSKRIKREMVRQILNFKILVFLNNNKNIWIEKEKKRFQKLKWICFFCALLLNNLLFIIKNSKTRNNLNNLKHKHKNNYINIFSFNLWNDWEK